MWRSSWTTRPHTSNAGTRRDMLANILGPMIGRMRWIQGEETGMRARRTRRQRQGDELRRIGGPDEGKRTGERVQEGQTRRPGGAKAVRPDPLAVYLVRVPTECTRRGSDFGVCSAVVSQDVAVGPFASAGGPKRKVAAQRSENEILVTMFATARACTPATSFGGPRVVKTQPYRPRCRPKIAAHAQSFSDSGSKGKADRKLCTTCAVLVHD